MTRSLSFSSRASTSTVFTAPVASVARRAAQHLELGAVDVELDVVRRVELEILDERIERHAEHALLIDRLSLLEALGIERARRRPRARWRPRSGSDI